MPKCYLTEHAGITPSGVVSSAPLSTQNAITVGATANRSAAFGVNTRAVRLSSDTPVCYCVGGRDATTNDAFMAGNGPAVVVPTGPGQWLSVITP